MDGVWARGGCGARARRVARAGSAIDFVEGVDGVTLSITLAILVLTVLTASWIPARAATRVDPMIALRSQ